MSVPLLLIRLLHDDLLRLPSPAATIKLNRSTEPLRVSGSSTTSSRALSGFGSTVIAFICHLLLAKSYLTHFRAHRQDHAGLRPQLHSFPLFRSSHQITSESV